jgi:hypothetical protein
MFSRQRLERTEQLTDYATALQQWLAGTDARAPLRASPHAPGS